MSHPLYLFAAAVLTTGLVPCALVAVRGRVVDGVVAVELAGVLATLSLVCVAVGEQQASYGTVALVCAAMTWVGGLLFVRFTDRQP